MALTLQIPPLPCRPASCLLSGTLLLVAALLAMLAPHRICAQERGDRAAYREDFDEGRARGWSLERGWTVESGQLIGREHHWARYEGDEWSGDRLMLRFALSSLKGRLHANFLDGDAGRYYVGIGSDGRIVDQLYLKKQYGPGRFVDLAEAPPLRILVTPRKPLIVTITCDGGRIDVSIDGKSVLRYADRQPLPAGIVAFETLEETFAVIDNVEIAGFLPARLATPDLRGLTPAEARRRHARLNLDIVVTGEQSSAQPVGQIVDQKPTPGSPLSEDRRVEVWLSQGPELAPQLVGQDPQAAQAQYPRLKIDAVGREVSRRQAGEIARQEPGAGRPLPDDRRIEVWLSQGPELAPQLVGQTLQAAQAQNPRLKIDAVGREAIDRPAGEITRQEPAAGRPLPDDHRIEVWLSQGPELAPQLVGQTLQAARTQHFTLGIDTVGREASDRPAGEITRQQPAAGAPLPDDRRVQVWISDAKRALPVTPDLTGLTEAEARRNHPQIDLSHADGMDAVSSEPAGRIIAQSPDAGIPLPADQRVRVGLSLGPQRSWTDSLPEAVIVAVIVGVIVLVRRLMRGKRPGEKASAGGQPMRVKPHADPGRQDLTTEGGPATLPAVRLRYRTDRGMQDIVPRNERQES